jgi:diacylglycerol kinase family enzyme
MQRLLLIANPASSQFTGGMHRAVARILARKYEVEPAWPQSAENARELTASAVADGVDIVAAMGGDGVAHHVGQALAGTDVALGVIPTGTTNVYARLYGIPKKPAAAARILTGAYQRQPVPVLEIEGVQDGGEVNRRALFAAGFGFDAEVVEAAESEPYRKYWFGGIHYARTAIGTVLGEYRTRPPNIRVAAGDRRADAVAVLAQFHPVYTYFGRLPLSFRPKPPDPMTLLVVESLPARRLMGIAATLMRRGDLGRVRGLRIWEEVESFRIQADPPVWGQADGEVTGAWNDVEIRRRPDAIQLIVPVPSGR